MAEGTPDISRIVKLIMDNPKIIEEIGDMVKSDKEAPSEEVATEATEKKDVPALVSENPKSKNRRDLLYALKPYLSEKRSQAIDSMLSVAEIFTMLKR